MRSKENQEFLDYLKTLPSVTLYLSDILKPMWDCFVTQVGNENIIIKDFKPIQFIRYFRTIFLLPPVTLDIINDMGEDFETLFRKPWED